LFFYSKLKTNNSKLLTSQSTKKSARHGAGQANDYDIEGVIKTAPQKVTGNPGRVVLQEIPESIVLLDFS
jgi:hypothetical protein